MPEPWTEEKAWITRTAAIPHKAPIQAGRTSGLRSVRSNTAPTSGIPVSAARFPWPWRNDAGEYLFMQLAGRHQPVDMPHLAAGARRALAVEVQPRARFGHEVRPAQHVV